MSAYDNQQAGFIGFVLDNTISGTDEERGLTRRRKAQLEAQLAGDTSYDFPWGMEAIKKYEFDTKVVSSR